MNIERKVQLQNYNTFSVPSVADYFCSVNSKNAMIECVSWAEKNGLPLHIIGGGSNVLLAPKIAGFVIQCQISFKKIVDEDTDHIWIEVGAGENWHSLVEWTLKHQMYGLENLALIPGLVGAAPIQNIGAYGVELCEVFERLEGLKLSDKKFTSLSKKDCDFAYRDSIFKRGLKNQFIISSVVLKLKKNPCLKLTYPALQAVLADLENPDACDVFNAVVGLRKQKLPDPLVIPNAGSFFKNPIVSGEFAAQLKKEYPDLPQYPQADGSIKLAAAWLIDAAGWKGREINGVEVHPKQALVLTNKVRGEVGAILAFADAVQRDIKQRFGVPLEVEPQLLGD